MTRSVTQETDARSALLSRLGLWGDKPDRNKQIVRDWLAGKTMKQIADDIGTSTKIPANWIWRACLYEKRFGRYYSIRKLKDGIDL